MRTTRIVILFQISDRDIFCGDKKCAITDRPDILVIYVDIYVIYPLIHVTLMYPFRHIYCILFCYH